jgi:hypothetical protein
MSLLRIPSTDAQDRCKTTCRPLGGDRSLLRSIGFVVIALVFVLLGHTLVLQRTEKGPTRAFTIRGDTISYKMMIEEGFTTVHSPYRYRILVPLIARLMPFSSFESLRIVSYVSLFVFYVVALETCAAFGLSLSATLLGLFAVYSSNVHLYCYHNPYYLDPFAIMVLALMLFFLLNDYFVPFSAAGLIGILGRENVIFLVPAWLAKMEWKRSVVLIVLAVVVMAIPRLILMPSIDQIIDGLHDPLTQKGFLPFVKEVFLSWRYMWLFILVGLVLVSDLKQFAACVAALSWFSLNPTVGFGIKTLFG